MDCSRSFDLLREIDLLHQIGGLGDQQLDLMQHLEFVQVSRGHSDLLVGILAYQMFISSIQAKDLNIIISELNEKNTKNLTQTVKRRVTEEDADD